jgi:hypothetical protein
MCTETLETEYRWQTIVTNTQRGGSLEAAGEEDRVLHSLIA